MAETHLWENPFREFLLSPTGRRLVLGQLEGKEHSTVGISVLAVDLADAVPWTLHYLKVQPVRTTARCHEIVDEVCRHHLSSEPNHHPSAGHKVSCYEQCSVKHQLI